MFLVNSRLGSFAAGDDLAATVNPYSEVTDAILPSSLTRVHPFTLVYSTTPPVLVCGTVSQSSRSDDFLGSRKGQTHPVKPGIWDPRSAHPADLPAGINTLRVPRAVNAHALTFPLRHTAPRDDISFPENMHDPKGSAEAHETINIAPLSISTRYRNIDLLSIGYAFRPGLRTD